MVSSKLNLAIIIFCIGFFLGGLLIGKAWNGRYVDDVTKIVRNSELATESLVIEQDLLEGSGYRCDLAEKRLSELSSQLWNLGKLLESEDSKSKIRKEDFNLLKRKFHLLQIRTFILYKPMIKDCKLNSTVILFFFGPSQEESAIQGRILDDLVKERDTKVFAIEYNYTKEISFIEEFYSINTTPSLVVNYEKVLRGLSGRKAIYDAARESS